MNKKPEQLRATRVSLSCGRERKKVYINVGPNGPYMGPRKPVAGDEALSGGKVWTVTKVEQFDFIAVVGRSSSVEESNG